MTRECGKDTQVFKELMSVAHMQSFNSGHQERQRETLINISSQKMMFFVLMNETTPH